MIVTYWIGLFIGCCVGLPNGCDAHAEVNR